MFGSFHTPMKERYRIEANRGASLPRARPSRVILTARSGEISLICAGLSPPVTDAFLPRVLIGRPFVVVGFRSGAPTPRAFSFPFAPKSLPHPPHSTHGAHLTPRSRASRRSRRWDRQRSTGGRVWVDWRGQVISRPRSEWDTDLQQSSFSASRLRFQTP